MLFIEVKKSHHPPLAPQQKQNKKRVLHKHTQLTIAQLLKSERELLLLLLFFLTFSVLVANPKKLLYTVANPARGLLNREKRTKEKVWQHTPPPHPPHCSFGENK